MRSIEIEDLVHQVEGELVVQRELPAERVDRVLVLGRPHVAERPVAGTGDAGDVAQAGRIEVVGRGERPRTALRPPADTELLVAERIGDRLLALAQLSSLRSC